MAGMGIETAHIEAIIEAHAETVDALKAERDRYKEKAEEVPELQAKLEEAEQDGQRVVELQEKYDALAKRLETAENGRKELQAEFDTYKGGVEERETLAAKAKAYRAQVVEGAGIAAEYVDAVMSVTNLDDVQMDEDGNVVGAKELSNGVKERYKAFVAHKRVERDHPENPPTQRGASIPAAHERAVQIHKEYWEGKYGRPKEQ